MKKRRFHINGEYYDIPDTEVSSFISDNPHAEEVRNYKIKGSEYNIPIKEVASFESDMGFDDHIQKDAFEKKSGGESGLEKSVPTTSPLSEDRPNPFDIKSILPKKMDNVEYTPPTSLEEAHAQDTDKSKAIIGNLRNQVALGQGSVNAGVGDLMFQFIQKIMPDDPYSKGAEQDLKNFRAEGEPIIRTALKETLGDKTVTAQQEKNFNDNFWTSALGGLAHTLPAMVGTKGSSFFLQAYDGGVQAINDTEVGKDLPESTKSIFGLGVGTAQAVIFKLGLDKIFGKQTTKAATNLALNTFSNLVKSSSKPITAEAFESALSVAAKSLKSRVLNSAAKVGTSAATGFAIGSAVEGSNELAKSITNKVEGEDVFEPTTWGEKFKNIVHAGASTAVGGAILGASTLPFSKTRNYISEKVADAKSATDITNLKNELIFKAKDLSPEEAQHLGQTIDDYVRVNSRVPDDVPNRKEVVDKIIEREEVDNAAQQKAQELQNVDEAFKPDIQKEIEVLNSKSQEINNEIDEIQKTEVPKSELESAIGEKPLENADKVEEEIIPSVPKNKDIIKNTKKVGEHFDNLVKNMERGEVEQLLYDWNEAEFNEDGTGIKRTGQFSRVAAKGKGETVRGGKSEFINWLNSNAPFDPKVYGNIIKDKEYVDRVNMAREAAGLEVEETPKPTVEKPLEVVSDNKNEVAVINKDTIKNPIQITPSNPTVDEHGGYVPPYKGFDKPEDLLRMKKGDNILFENNGKYYVGALADDAHKTSDILKGDATKYGYIPQMLPKIAIERRNGQPPLSKRMNEVFPIEQEKSLFPESITNKEVIPERTEEEKQKELDDMMKPLRGKTIKDKIVKVKEIDPTTNEVVEVETTAKKAHLETVKQIKLLDLIKDCLTKTA